MMMITMTKYQVINNVNYMHSPIQVELLEARKHVVDRVWFMVALHYRPGGGFCGVCTSVTRYDTLRQAII